MCSGHVKPVCPNMVSQAQMQTRISSNEKSCPITLFAAQSLLWLSMLCVTVCDSKGSPLPVVTGLDTAQQALFSQWHPDKPMRQHCVQLVRDISHHQHFSQQTLPPDQQRLKTMTRPLTRNQIPMSKSMATTVCTAMVGSCVANAVTRK